VKRGVFFKLLAVFVLVIATATMTLDFAIRRAWENSLRQEIERAMVQKTRLFAHRVETDHSRPLQQLVNEEAAAGDVRATVIDRSGKVLADSEANPDRMENHATRPEFITAFQGGIGSATRWSHTLGVPFLYVAAPIPGGAVRMAYPLASVQQTTATVRRTLLLASAIALLVATLLAALIAQMISRRLARIVAFARRVAAGDLSARIALSSTDEIATVAAALDATARKLEESFAALETSRSQLETLLNSMQEAVIAVAPDGKVLWVNGRMQRLVAAGVRLGAPVVESVRDPNFLGAVNGALQGKRISSARATSFLPGRVFEVTAAPMGGAGAVAVLHDVTELERVEKTRRDFIANVSHELRTPLTSVQGYAETLMDSDDPANAREFLGVILKNAARMSRLTEDLLVLARVESGEQRFDIRAVTPADLLHAAVETCHAAAQAAGVQLTVENTGGGPVLADAEAIHQVFGNLIDNAVKYAASGARIVLGARAGEHAVEFYVRDFGPGIASEHLPRLFERFYRVDKARSRESGGTGLGLAIVKHIVLAHGGQVRAESELGHGSTFYFTLPLAATGAAATLPGPGMFIKA
jgi:two-component system phosphate regulon sensor histidine kinase PhoR